MDKVGYSEDFEKEIGIRMHRAVDERKLKGRVEMVMDETSVIGILDERICEDEYFKDYEEIALEDLRLSKEEAEWKNEEHISYVFGHPDLAYHLSPHYFGSALLYLQRNFNEAHLYADKRKTMPFMLRARRLQERYERPAFVIAPVVLGPCKKR